MGWTVAGFVTTLTVLLVVDHVIYKKSTYIYADQLLLA